MKALLLQKMASIDEAVAERDKEKDGKLGGLDLETAELDDMSMALGRLECEKRDLLENIRVLRVRLADEKVMILHHTHRQWLTPEESMYT